MSQFRCVVQEAGEADVRSDELEHRLRAHHAEHYPADAVTITWSRVPHGRMFTEGRQSTSSIVSCFVDHKTTFELRESYMRSVCDLWTELTGCTDHEVVVTITETVAADQE